MVYRCLFEQSGTFKNAFRSLGLEAYDYDISNNFGETDYVSNLLVDIDMCNMGFKSIFDGFSPEDLILAFYPCIRFDDQAFLSYQCTGNHLYDKSDLFKCEFDLKLYHELYNFARGFMGLVHIALERNFRLIIEQPYSKYHFINKYSFLKPSYIDFDRRLRGDFFKKPTQYFTFNFEFKNNFVSDPLVINDSKRVLDVYGFDRSRISPDYALRFIKEFIV